MVPSKISKQHSPETDSDSDAQVETPFPNFVSVKEKPITKLSLFIVKKFLASIYPKSVKTTKKQYAGRESGKKELRRAPKDDYFSQKQKKT